MSKKNVVFENVDTLVSYLIYHNREISPLKLQACLYFLFSFYISFYGQRDKEGIFEGTNQPCKLFDVKFMARKYGPMVTEVYEKNKNDFYLKNIDNVSFEVLTSNHEIKQFIDDIIEQIAPLNDFDLMERCHSDQSWLTAYQDNNAAMDHFSIQNEYIEKCWSRTTG